MNISTYINNNKQFRYQFRENRSLVIFADFRVRIYRVADMIEGECMQVQEVTRAQQYEDGRGDIVVKLITGYDRQLAESEIISIFKYFAV